LCGIFGQVVRFRRTASFRGVSRDQPLTLEDFLAPDVVIGALGVCQFRAGEVLVNLPQGRVVGENGLGGVLWPPDDRLALDAFGGDDEHLPLASDHPGSVRQANRSLRLQNGHGIRAGSLDRRAR